MLSSKLIRKFLIAAALAVPIAMLPATQAHAAVFISVGFAPPVLPVYAQPICPGDGYIWTPGYWAYSDDGGYYWVPGVWVEPPVEGYLWTPAYWGWEGGVYRFYPGYWGTHVGFYGGINYGFGYGGVGFYGGEWRGGHFFYNGAVANLGGLRGGNVYYDRNVVVRNTIVNSNHTSFNGGAGGIQARPTHEEAMAMHEQHIQPTSAQMQHQSFSAQNRSQFASANHGRPGVTAAATPAAFRSRGTVNTREANQQQRIANGVRSGQMTSGEAAHADQRQANIDSQVHNDRVQHGGRLTSQEHQQVNREQNNTSHQIHNENHNTRTAPAHPQQPRR